MHPDKFIETFKNLKEQELLNQMRFPTISGEDLYPCLNDDTSQTAFDEHYIYHTAWAARVLAEIKPSIHYDIASSLYFSALVSAFIPVCFFDYRPAPLFLSGLKSEHVDLTKLPFADQSVPSLSCMHVIEHIGLGRYGDPLDYNGDLRAIAELKRVVSKGGSLLLVVPIGQPRICFNAHRIYAFENIRECFSDFRLEQFALIPDNAINGLVYNPSLEFTNSQRYGCGCFWLTRL
ncbi:MAG: DUF268 domain-containing protein [Pelosinus sp.]|nr:DUF268 domain-containing protein [Pelosinus sp.]